MGSISRSDCVSSTATNTCGNFIHSEIHSRPYGIQPINKALSELEIAGTKPPTQVDGSSESEDETQRPDNENVVVRAADEEQLLRELEFATTYVSNVAVSNTMLPWSSEHS